MTCVPANNLRCADGPSQVTGVDRTDLFARQARDYRDRVLPPGNSVRAVQAVPSGGLQPTETLSLPSPWQPPHGC